MKNNIKYLEKYLSPDKLKEGIKQLEKGIPVQYIVGNVNFYGNLIEVTPDVLIPRFETEELVYKTINYINKYFDKNIKIVDLGTGSGCIAITLAKKLNNTHIDAVDISKKALEVAKKNAKLNNVQINFYLGNMLEPLTDKYDCIISNPPYISVKEEVMGLVKNNEPNLALYANNDGLEFYELILRNARNFLKEKSLIAFEIGYKQGTCIEKIAYKYFPNAIIKIEKDMQGRNRFLFIFNNLSD